MAANAMIRFTEDDYNRVKRLLAELTHQSMGMQATLKILEELVDVRSIVRLENAPSGVVTMNAVVHLQDVALRKKEG